jgi:hypothetical protein
MEIAQFYTLLEHATTVEEEEFDVRFEEVVSLVEQEKFEEAVPLITAILNDGIIDIRLVMYLFYADFLEGIGRLKGIFPAIMTLLDEHWESISPPQMRDKHALSSITWFLSSIVKKLKRSEKLYKEKRADDFWMKSIESLSHPDVEELKTAAERFSQFLTQKLDQPSLNQYIMFISKWLGSLEHVVAVEEDKPKANKKSEPPKNPPVKSRQKKTSLEEILLSSEPMVLFLKKIQTFEALIEKQDFEKAAVIADDITTIIEKFDPTFFFPKLFVRYFALTAAHIDILSDEWKNKSSLKWESLNRLYQADLEEFIQW